MQRREGQKQFYDICVEVEAENMKENTRQLFQKAKVLSQKFQPRLQRRQSGLKSGESWIRVNKISIFIGKFK